MIGQAEWHHPSSSKWPQNVSPSPVSTICHLANPLGLGSKNAQGQIHGQLGEPERWSASSSHLVVGTVVLISCVYKLWAIYPVPFSWLTSVGVLVSIAADQLDVPACVQQGLRMQKRWVFFTLELNLGVINDSKTSSWLQILHKMNNGWTTEKVTTLSALKLETLWGSESLAYRFCITTWLDQGLDYCPGLLWWRWYGPLHFLQKEEQWTGPWG